MSLSGKGRSRASRVLRVAVVTETYPPEVNGVAATTAVMVRGLIARGHSVEVIRPRQADRSRTHPTPACDEIAVWISIALAHVPPMKPAASGMPKSAG